MYTFTDITRTHKKLWHKTFVKNGQICEGSGALNRVVTTLVGAGAVLCNFAGINSVILLYYFCFMCIVFCRDITLTSEQLQHFLVKIIRLLKSTDLQELPPVVYQLLALSVKVCYCLDWFHNSPLIFTRPPRQFSHTRTDKQTVLKVCTVINMSGITLYYAPVRRDSRSGV